MRDIGTSALSREWSHTDSLNAPYGLCTFRCPSETTYNATNNTCNAVITDTTAPSVTSFTIPELSSTLIVPIVSFTASETGVSYLLTESTTKPLASAG